MLLGCEQSARLVENPHSLLGIRTTGWESAQLAKNPHTPSGIRKHHSKSARLIENPHDASESHTNLYIRMAMDACGKKLSHTFGPAWIALRGVMVACRKKEVIGETLFQV